MAERIYFLDLDDVLESHAYQIETYGGDSGLRDVRLLESAIAQPSASFVGEYLHAFPFEMAAAYLFHLVMNHPFVDGNKRVGLECAMTFLKVNGIEIDALDDELVELVINTTSGILSKKSIADYFESRRVKSD